jgi:hypothetical protein
MGSTVQSPGTSAVTFLFWVGDEPLHGEITMGVNAGAEGERCADRRRRMMVGLTSCNNPPRPPLSSDSQLKSSLSELDGSEAGTPLLSGDQCVHGVPVSPSWTETSPGSHQITNETVKTARIDASGAPLMAAQHARYSRGSGLHGDVTRALYPDPLRGWEVYQCWSNFFSSETRSALLNRWLTNAGV